MIKKIAWETFKNTGNINTFLEYKEIQNLEKKLENSSQINKENLEDIGDRDF